MNTRKLNRLELRGLIESALLNESNSSELANELVRYLDNPAQYQLDKQQFVEALDPSESDIRNARALIEQRARKKIRELEALWEFAPQFDEGFLNDL